MKKKDTRILFNMNSHGQISDVCIKEFKYRQVETWPMHLYQKYSSDIGNCFSEWDEWDFCDILLFMFKFQFDSEKTIDKFYVELTKIDEFKEQVTKYVPYRMRNE